MYKAVKIKHLNKNIHNILTNYKSIKIYTVRLSFYGKNILIISNNNNIITRLKKFYYYFIDDNDLTTTGAQYAYNHIIIYTGGNKFFFAIMKKLFLLSGEDTFISLFSFDNFAYFFKNIELQYFFSGVYLRNFILDKLSKEFVFIHGASLAYNGKAIIIPGAAAIGKTSTSFLLMQKNFIIKYPISILKYNQYSMNP